MSNTLVLLIIVAILALAIGYIIQQKRKGVKCVGCASAQSSCCGDKAKQSCNCSSQIDEKPKQ